MSINDLEQQLINNVHKDVNISDLVRKIFKENPLFLHHIYDALKNEGKTNLFLALLEKIHHQDPQVFDQAQLILDEQGNTLFLMLLAREVEPTVHLKIIELTSSQVMEQVWLQMNNKKYLPLQKSILKNTLSFTQALIAKASPEAIEAAFHSADNYERNLLHVVFGFSTDEDNPPLTPTELIDNLALFFQKAHVSFKVINELFLMQDEDRRIPLQFLFHHHEAWPEDRKKDSYPRNEHVIIPQMYLELAEKSNIPISILYFLGHHLTEHTMELAVNIMLCNEEINKLSEKLDDLPENDPLRKDIESKLETLEETQLNHEHQVSDILFSLERMGRKRPNTFFDEGPARKKVNAEDENNEQKDNPSPV